MRSAERAISLLGLIMPHNAFAQNPLKIFSDDSVRRIHKSALHLLDAVGVRIDCEEALALLADYGVRCDLQRRRAHPDEDCIQRALKTVQREYELFGRKPGRATPLQIAPDTTHAISGGAAIKLYSGGAYRDAARKDLVDMAVLHEKLDNIHVLINPVEPAEMRGRSIYPEIAAELFCHSSKPLLLQANGRRDIRKLIHMGALLVGGEQELARRPRFMTGANGEPPMAITRAGAEILIDAPRAGIPVSMGVYLMAGATGPLDVAASIVQRTATNLCALTLTQAAKPGSSCDFSCQSGCCDLATGDVVTMSPMAMQIVAGSIQVGRFYNLPTHSIAATEAKTPDGQASGERFFSLAVSLMAGASFVQGATSEMSGMELADFAQCVIDNEIAGYLFEFAGGVGMDRLDEAVGVIEEVVKDPQYSGLYFLGHPHTAKHSHQRACAPDLFSIGMLSRWLAEKRDNLYDMAQRRVKELLAERRDLIPEGLKAGLFQIALEE